MYNVPEDSLDNISTNLVCPNCGTELERFVDIGLEDIGDRIINEHISKAKAKYGKKINDFVNTIKRYPTLALSQPLVKNIKKEIANRVISTCTIRGTYFRARTLSNSKVLNSEDFLAPPLGKSQEGRFNHAGQNHFYIADCEEVAINECISDISCILTLL